MSHWRAHRILVGLGLLAALVALVALAGADALAALPALVALWLPACGRYVGETRLARLASRRATPVRRAPGTTAPSRPGALRPLPRGGRLIAARLAWRGPPPSPATA
jgi:hypothetical protein